MRTVLWDLLLLCLFARARGDCRGDCLHCDRQLYRDSFDVLVCILECEGEAVPRATWELCAAAAGRAAPRPRDLQDAPWRGAVPAVPPANPFQRSGTASQHLPPGTGKINPAPARLHPLSDGPQSASDSHAVRNHFALHSLKPDLTPGPEESRTATGSEMMEGGWTGPRGSGRKFKRNKAKPTKKPPKKRGFSPK
ncbi:prepronociceptin isoform X3 [Patagioenas fasciata]|uniref:prepronociceptin isoform X3 n=1 Tax=Patagioenas fasciata TaxID=372321 RepID=UPI0032E8BC81